MDFDEMLRKELGDLGDCCVLECCNARHNKVYILLQSGGRLYRFWGRHDTQLSAKVEQSTTKTFDQLITMKLYKKSNMDSYIPVENPQGFRYQQYARQISFFVKNQRRAA